jgi:hypothetical protein
VKFEHLMQRSYSLLSSQSALLNHVAKYSNFLYSYFSPYPNINFQDGKNPLFSWAPHFRGEKLFNVVQLPSGTSCGQCSSSTARQERRRAIEHLGNGRPKARAGSATTLICTLPRRWRNSQRARASVRRERRPGSGAFDHSQQHRPRKRTSGGPRDRAACATAEVPSQEGAQCQVCICTPFVLVKEIVLSSF